MIHPAGERPRLSMHRSVRYASELRWAASVGDQRNADGCFRWAFIRLRQPPARSREDPVLGCVTNVSENLQSCIEDGRRPPGVDFQELASNHPELLRSKGVVVSDRGKVIHQGGR